MEIKFNVMLADEGGMIFDDGERFVAHDEEALIRILGLHAYNMVSDRFIQDFTVSIVIKENKVTVN